MLNIDEIKGKARQIVGAIKENLDWLTNDHKNEEIKSWRQKKERTALSKEIRRSAIV